MAKRNLDALLRGTDFNRNAAAVTGSLHIEKSNRRVSDSDGSEQKETLFRQFPTT